MSFPLGASTITVTGTFPVPAGGTAQSGAVVFTPTAVLVDSTQHAIYSGGGSATLNATGQISIVLLCTDDSDVQPSGWRWRVDEQIPGSRRTYFVDLPSTLGATVDLSTLSPVSAPGGAGQSLPPTGPAGGALTGAYPNPQLSTATIAAFLPAAGGTVSGALVIDRFGAPAGFPIGSTGAVASLSVPSSYAGGDDDGIGTDSTGRINLYSYQRANFNSYGENIRNFAMRSDAKTMQAFYIPVDATKKGGYDPATRNPKTSGIGWKPVVWQGAHYESNSHDSIHGHWELEIADSTGALQGRLEIPFIDQLTDGTKPLDQATIGVDYTNIRTNLADFSVRAQNITSGPYSGTNTALRVGGANDRNKDVALSISSDMGTSGRRWILRANTTTEAGSNAGTDFQLLRYDDTGAQLGTAVMVRRSDGNVALGSTAVGSARVTAIWGTSGHHGYSATPSASPGSAAAFDAQMTATADRAFQAALPADANRRWVVFTDGKTEWGDGTAARDANLYRSNPGVLKTDGALQATTSLRLNTTSVGGGVGVIAVANATTAPAANPTGGIVMYVSNGRLKIRQPDGTDQFVALTAT